jgi:hypothetical protein
MPEDTITGDQVSDEAFSDHADASDAAAEAEADAFLAKMHGDDETLEAPDTDGASTDEATEGQPRDDKGQFKSKDTEPSKDSKEADEPAVPESVNPDEYRKALAALQRDGVPPKSIEALDPGDVLAWGLKRASVQADSDRLSTKLGELRKKEAASKATDTDSEPVIDLKEAAKPFAEFFGDDSAEPLEAFGKHILEQVQAPAKETEARLLAMQQQLQSMQQNAARERLTKQYDLKGEDRWNRVLERRASDQNDYTDEQVAINNACLLEFAEEIIAEGKAKVKEQHKLRENGQSTTQSVKEQPRAKTNDQLEDDILNAIQDGDRERAEKLGRAERKGRNETVGSPEQFAEMIGVKR